MIKDTNEIKLLNDFKDINKKLDDYDKLNNLIRRKIELTLKLVNSNSFKESVYSWGISNPEEMISLYIASKSEDGFIITYGKDIIDGIYLDFCQLFLSATNNKITKKYIISNLKTKEEKSIELNKITSHYTSRELRKFKASLHMRVGEETILLPLVNNDYVVSDDCVKYGCIQIDALIKQALSNTIEELFCITEAKTDDSSSREEAYHKVIPLLLKKDKALV